MQRDYTKPVAIMLTGSGSTKTSNFEANFEDYVFGNPEDGHEPHLTIILPLLESMGDGMRDMLAHLENRYGPDEWVVIQPPGGILTKHLASLNPLRVESEREALQKGFNLLADLADTHDVSFMMLFNPDSVYVQGDKSLTDAEIIADAKAQPGLMTWNICEGLQDSFPGYESEEERKHREEKLAEYKAEQDRLNALALKSGVNPEGSTTPRKRVARKTAAKKVTAAPKAVTEPSEPVLEASTPALDKLIEKSVAKEEEKRAARKTELTATVAVPAKVTDTVIEHPDMDKDFVYADDVVAKSPWDSSRQDALLIELGENIAAMGDAFTKTIRTMTELIKERNV